MTVWLVHPQTGGEFAARESAVPHYQRSGWQVKADWLAQQQETPAMTAPVTTKTAGKAAEVTKE